MQDTISKNTGNSRYLASVPNFLTLYPTYEAFAQALINRELPIDLGPLNPAGCKQIGDSLNKENLLKDSTAALYGKPATAVPDDILAAIRPLITSAQNTANGKSICVSGSYTGNNQDTKTINFTFNPKAFFLVGSTYRFIPVGVGSTEIVTHISDIRTLISFSGKSIVLSKITGQQNVFNMNGTIYYYVAIG